MVDIAGRFMSKNQTVIHKAIKKGDKKIFKEALINRRKKRDEYAAAETKMMMISASYVNEGEELKGVNEEKMTVVVVSNVVKIEGYGKELEVTV